MDNVTAAVYQNILDGELELCNPDPVIVVDTYYVYGLAVESQYDPDNNLTLQPADAPYEFWQFSFEFEGCPDNQAK